MRLDNGLVRFDFDDETGSVRQITDLRTGKRFLNDTRGNRLAKVILPTPDHMSRPLYSHEAGRPAMAREGDALRMAFPELTSHGRKQGVFLTVTVRLPAGATEAVFQAEIRNASPFRVHELWFPWLGGRKGKPGQRRETITTSQRVFHDIYAQFFEQGASTHTFGHHHLRLGLPTTHLLPMLDLSEADGGLSYNKYESRPSPQLLVFDNATYEREDLCLTWSWAANCFVEPGETWTSAECGVGVHQGDWHETADRFRRWLETWWQAADTPPAVREKIGLFHVQTHTFSGETCHEFSELPEIVQDAKQYGVDDLMFWDCTASIYMRPDHGDFWEMPRRRLQELKTALAEVRKQGCSVSSFVNWRLAAVYNGTWPKLQPLIQKSIFGVDLFGFPSATMDGAIYNDLGVEVGMHPVCCGADGYLPYARKLLTKTLDLGFDVIAVDQAGEWNYCVAADHGHESPWEAWQRTYDWYAEVARTTRQREPEAYTVAEVPDLFNTQYLDLWWNWMWRGNQWANLPVFRYVMPTMIPCWCIDENQRDVLAEAFALGSFLAIATRDMTGRLSDAPELAAQIARLAKLRRDTAAWVAHGRFRDDRGLQVRGGTGYVYTSDRGLAITLANSKPRKATVRVKLTPEALGYQVSGTPKLYLEGEKPVALTPATTGDVLAFRAVLPPYGAAVLILPAARG